MLQQKGACHYVNDPSGFYLVENVVIVRRKFRASHNAHRGDIETTG